MALVNIGKSILANSVSVAILQMTGIPDKMRAENNMANYLLAGLTLSISEDGVSYWFGDRAVLILEMRWQDLLDRSVSNAVLLGGVQWSQLDVKLLNMIQSVSPLGDKLNQDLTFGALITAFTIIRDYWEVDPRMAVLNHPSRLLF